MKMSNVGNRNKSKIKSSAAPAKRRGSVRFRLALVGLGLAAPAAAHAGLVVNFHDANQGYAYYGGYDTLFYGQGAAPDAGNNVWNGFGGYQGPSTVGVFYGGGNPNSGLGGANAPAGPNLPSAYPGNPYAWYSGTTTSGTNKFVPSSSPATSGFGNVYSNGTISPVTLSLSYGNGDNGATGGAVQGSPSFLFSHAALATGGSTGTITLGGVPTTLGTTYNLYLYGANYDGNRGAVFGVASSGFTAVGGYTATMNTGGGPLNSYVLGGDYVEFTGITPTSAGQIIATWTGGTNTITGQSGEGDFNGLQLVSVPAVGSTYIYYGYDGLNPSGTADSGFGGTGANFNNSGNAAAFANGSSGATALFDDSAPGPHTINVISTGVSPNLTYFNNSQSTYTVTGGPISGPGGLTVAGGGTVFLNSSNTYTGSTSITNGTLVLNPGSSLASASITVVSNANLNIPTGTSTAAGKFTNSALAVSDYGTITLGGSANLGSLTGTGTVTFNVSGTTLTLTGGAFSGTVNASGSIVELTGAGGTFGSSFNDGSSPNSVAVNATGTWDLSGNNSYTGGTTLTAGTTLGGQTGFSTGPVVLAGGLIGGIAGGSAAMVPGVVSGSALLVAAGSGTLELQNTADTFTGPIIVQGGALQLDSTGAIGGVHGSNASSGFIIVASGGSLIANDNSGFLGLTGGVSGGAPIPLQITGSGLGGNGALQGGGSTSTYAGPISVVGPSTISPGPTSQFTVTGSISGSGTLTFGSNSTDSGGAVLILAPKTSNTYTGETQVTGDAGAGSLTLQLGANNAISTASGINVLYGPANGLAVDLNGYNQSIGYLAGSSNGNYIVTTNSGPSVLTVTSGLRGGVPSTFGTTIQGNVALVMNDPTGLGNQVLSGNNSYSGGTTITKGTLTAASANALGNGPVLLKGGTLSLTVPGVPVAGTPIVTSANFSSSTLTLNNAGGAAPSVTGNVLQLTTNGTGNTGNSIFYNTKVPVSDSAGFTASFNYNVSAGYADGITFLLQNDPRGALAVSSAAGGSLAYQGTGKITNSVAVAFEIYPFAFSYQTAGTGLGINGFLPGNGGLPGYVSTAPVNIGTILNPPGNPAGVYLDPASINVTLVYNGPAETLTETLVNSLEGQSFTTSYTGVDYSSLLGGTPGGSTTAYLGFTGATGGASATQLISNFSYAPNLAYSTTAAGSPSSITNLITAAASTTSIIQIGTSSTANNSGGAVGAITINSGAVVNVNAPSGSPRGVLFTPSVSIATSGAGAFTGKLDLAANDLVVTNSSILQVTALLASGYNGGNWNGQGIASSVAAGNTTHLTALGVIINDSGANTGSNTGNPLYGTNGGLYSTLDGSTPSDGNILVKYTYYGDANLDGAIDGTDYGLIDNGFQKHLSGWYNGDFNYDGVVDGSDYTLMDNAFNQQGSTLGSNPAALLATSTAQIAGSAVPEPTSLALLGISAIGLLGRRTRRNAKA